MGCEVFLFVSPFCHLLALSTLKFAYELNTSTCASFFFSFLEAVVFTSCVLLCKVLFTGDVRFNVDPFGDHPDAAVWSALDRAHLGAHVATLPDGLASEVEEGGRNFSMGQRQLLCLARALLRASRILLLDEATSAVDHHTDTLVQATIRSEFAHCTVLTIAHRLDTVVDYDRVLVLSDGKLVEDDSPTKLLDPEVYPNGIFGTMYSAHQQGLL